MSMRLNLRPALLGLCLLVCTVGVLWAGEPPPKQPINPWYGKDSPFVFSEGAKGEKLVKIGNQEYWLLTPDKLAADPNPGLAHRNVAIVGSVGLVDSAFKGERKWIIELSGDKTVYTHAANSYEENLDMVKGLQIGHDVMLVGQAKASVDGKGSVLVVTKPYRIPLELDRYESFFQFRLENTPDYFVFKTLADELEAKALVFRAHNDEHSAEQYRTLKDKVVSELLSLREALVRADKLDVDELLEFMNTILKYTPDDRARAAEVLKRVMAKDPRNPKIIEPQRALLPDWVLCAEAKKWMPRADCDKLRQDALAAIEKIRQQQIDQANKHMADVAMNSNTRHVILLKNQALIVDQRNKLPAGDSAEFSQLVNLLKTSDDYRLVQQLMLQAVAQLDTKEWLRLVEPLVNNPSIPVRLLAYRLGGYSQDLATVRQLVAVLRADKTEMLKDDAIKALCETRAKSTVLALGDCFVNSTDDTLNTALLNQLQRLTNLKETDKDAWQKYLANPEKVVVVAE